MRKEEIDSGSLSDDCVGRDESYLLLSYFVKTPSERPPYYGRDE